MSLSKQATISLALRSGIPLMEIHGQLRGIASDRAIGLGPIKVLSVPGATGIVLERWWRDKQGVQTDMLAGQSRGDVPAREQVTSSATLGTTTLFSGNILALTSITLNTGARHPAQGP